MKQKFFITLLLLLFFGAFSSAMACDPGDPACEQTADGNAALYAPYDHGDAVNGGWSQSVGNADYHVTDPHTADGSANIHGRAVGNNGPGISWSTACLRDETQGNGASVNLSHEGETAQGNWAEESGSLGNYAGGGDSTSAGYSGEMNGSGELSLEGSSFSGGGTCAEVQEGTETNNSHAITTGGSRSCQNVDGQTTAQGTGGVVATSYKENGPAWAGASGEGTFCYDTQGTHFSAGRGLTETNTEIAIHGLPNGVQANASSTTHSEANSHSD